MQAKDERKKPQSGKTTSRLRLPRTRDKGFAIQRRLRHRLRSEVPVRRSIELRLQARGTTRAGGSLCAKSTARTKVDSPSWSLVTW